MGIHPVPGQGGLAKSKRKKETVSKKNQKKAEEMEQEQVAVESTEKVEKVPTVRIYKFTGKRPENARGQVTAVLKALDALNQGKLDEFVAKVNELDPTYKTKTPMEASVKFHLHQLARKGFVEEIDQPVEQTA